MGLGDFIKEQFLDVIEYIDESNKILVYKYTNRPSNEIKQGSRVIVREGQCAVFVKGGQIADIFKAGTYRLNSDNLPLLSAIAALPFLLNSPIKSDLYFISTKQSTDNKWATKNAIMMRDKDFGVMRIRAFGKYSFKITDVELFMKDLFGSQKKVTTWDIVEYLESFVTSSFAEVIAEIQIPALDLASKYKFIASEIKNYVNIECEKFGIQFVNINIENISLPEDVEKLIDEQSGIGLASKDMEIYTQYQSIRAMRDAAKQKGGLAGIGAGAVLAKQMMNDLTCVKKQEIDIYEEIVKYKKLLDSGAITSEEYNDLKKKLLNQN